MGREFELKYAATEEQLFALQERYPHLVPISMHTTYYDTPDGRLSRLHWTLRRRLENGNSICTLKTPLPDGSRGEWEIPCPEITAAIPALITLGAPKELEAFSGALAVSCGARFTRLAGLVELESCTVELALDRGVLLGRSRELPFREMEVELKSGSEALCAAFARTLAQELGMKAEPRSKVARARLLD